jgi:hypothetical protein
MLNWLDQALGFRRRSGASFEGTPLDLSDGFADDPIVAVEAGHPAVELGFEFLLRDILQIACPPADDVEWAERLLEPPAPGELRRALEPHRRAFVLDDPEFPTFQIRPIEDRLKEYLAKNKQSDMSDLVSSLLPENRSKNQRDKQVTGFFNKVDESWYISVGLILPLFYHHMIMFSIGGGGYLYLPHRTAIKFQMIGNSLWERIWINILSVDDEVISIGPWPALATVVFIHGFEKTCQGLRSGESLRRRGRATSGKGFRSH